MNRILSIFAVVSMVLGGLIAGQLLISMSVTAPDPEYLSDLTISPQNVSISPGTPVVGEPVIINATVWNVGTSDARNVKVNFYEGETLIGIQNVDILVNGTWTNHTIDYEGNMGGYSSIGVDSEKSIHISYYDDTSKDLKYSIKQLGGNWIYQTIDSGGRVGKYSSLAVDSANGIHISYFDGTNFKLKYAYKPNEGNWIYSILDSVGDSTKTSIAVDSSNGVHISYYDAANEDLRYVYKPSGGIWTNDTVDSTGIVGTYCSIAVDGSNGVHISYIDATNYNLKYAYKPSGGIWTNDTVDSTGSVGTHCSIAVDGSNGVHISYFDTTNMDLKYANKTSGGNWTLETVDSNDQVGRYTSLAVDNNDIHISYRDNWNRDLKYATRSSGGNWTIDKVDTIGDVGIYTSIAVDDSNGVHLSYRDSGNLDLKYASLIKPPSYLQLSVPWTPTTAGLRNITVIIDENNEIEELNELNNNAMLSVTVEPGPLASIEIAPSSVLLELNDTQQFISTGYDYYGNEISISPTWEVNGGGTIDQSGLFSTNYPGTWTVNANQSDISGIATVTVKVNGTTDIDTDGMLDWWEIEYDLDPFDGSDVGLDPDLDYLTNLQEFFNYSNPNNNETDGDSLGDGFEVIFSKTNASNWDTNGNGIGDGLEFIQSQGYLGWIGSLPDDWIGMTISWENYTIYVKTNSSVLEGEFDKEERELKIKVSGPEGTQGVTELDIPKGLCDPDDIEIVLDGELINFTLTEDDYYYYIHIEYNHSVHELTASFLHISEMPDQPLEDDERGLLEDWSFIGLIIAIIIIVLLLILITGIRSGKEDIGVQELPPEQLFKLLEKKHAEGKITDDTFNDAKSLLEKYGGG